LTYKHTHASFAACLYCLSETFNTHKLFIWTIYIAFLLVSVIPLFVDVIRNGPNPPLGGYRDWPFEWFWAMHSFCILPVVTILTVAAVFFQAREILLHPLPRALSLVGLRFQAVVFALAAVFWVRRVHYSVEEIDQIALYDVIRWCLFYGYPAVNNAVFAVSLAVLLGFAMKHAAGHAEMPASGETEPLLP
jgi:hypothetical protein